MTDSVFLFLITRVHILMPETSGMMLNKNCRSFSDVATAALDIWHIPQVVSSC